MFTIIAYLYINNYFKLYKLHDWIDHDKLEFQNILIDIENINAINLLENNQNKINWKYFSENPNMFKIDYIFLKIRINEK